MAATPDTG